MPLRQLLRLLLVLLLHYLRVCFISGLLVFRFLLLLKILPFLGLRGDQYVLLRFVFLVRFRIS